MPIVVGLVVGVVIYLIGRIGDPVLRRRVQHAVAFACGIILVWHNFLPGGPVEEGLRRLQGFCRRPLHRRLSRRAAVEELLRMWDEQFPTWLQEFRTAMRLSGARVPPRNRRAPSHFFSRKHRRISSRRYGPFPAIIPQEAPINGSGSMSARFGPSRLLELRRHAPSVITFPRSASPQPGPSGVQGLRRYAPPVITFERPGSPQPETSGAQEVRRPGLPELTTPRPRSKSERRLRWRGEVLEVSVADSPEQGTELDDLTINLEEFWNLPFLVPFAPGVTPEQLLD